MKAEGYTSILRLIPADDRTALVACDLFEASRNVMPGYESTILRLGLAHPKTSLSNAGLRAIPWTVQITKDLLTALRGLRSDRGCRNLGVDQLGIKQHDLEERPWPNLSHGLKRFYVRTGPRRLSSRGARRVIDPETTRRNFLAGVGNDRAGYVPLHGTPSAMRSLHATDSDLRDKVFAALNLAGPRLKPAMEVDLHLVNIRGMLPCSRPEC